MAELKVTQVRSAIGRPRDQKDTIRRLGIHRLHGSVIKQDRPEILGMIAKVRHLVTVEPVGSTMKRRARAEGEGEAS
jgi:large subunit ribosomal protein L30